MSAVLALPKLAHVLKAIDCIWRRVVHTLGAFRQLSCHSLLLWRGECQPFPSE